LGFMGVLATVAQAGQAAVSAPSNVSVATSASGDYNDAITGEHNECSSTAFAISGDDFSNGGVSIDVNIGQLGSAFSGCGSGTIVMFTGVGRHTGGTSFEWTLTSTSSTSLNNGNSVAIIGTPTTTASTLADSDGIGEKMQMTFGGGRGGLSMPAAGDNITLEVKFTATNSGGSTADTVDIVYNFVL